LFSSSPPIKTEGRGPHISKKWFKEAPGKTAEGRVFLKTGPGFLK